MNIERIRLENVSVSPHSGAHVATVLLDADTASLSLRASALPLDHASVDVVTRALVQDALRQVRRMPEYRMGTKVITIAENAWPVPAEQA